MGVRERHVHERPRPDILHLDGPGGIDWSALSEQGKATARRIALPLSMGYTVWEVAHSIGITRSSVERLVGELRNELERDATW